MRRAVLVYVLVLAMMLSMLPLVPTVAAGGGNTVTGTVVLDMEGKPPAIGANVTMWNASTGAWVNSTVTNETGSYSMVVPDGTYNFTVELMGYHLELALNNHPVQDDQFIDVDASNRGPFVLIPIYGDVEGLVDYNGTPVIGANVSIRNGADVLATTETNATGEYSLTSLTGERTIRVENDGFVVYESQITIIEADTVVRNVALTALNKYSLNGTVETAQGGLEGVNVTVVLASGALPPTSTLSDSEGRFHFDDLIEGVYLISVSRDAFIQWIVPEEIVLTSNKTLFNPLAMREAFGNVEGRVFNGTFMISDAVVRLLDSSGVEVDVVNTDSRGEYEFVGIPTGTYILKVERNDFVNTQREIRINASDVLVVDFDLERIDRSYLFGQDLAHSLMIIAIVISSAFLVGTLMIRNRILREPGLLYIPPEEED